LKKPFSFFLGDFFISCCGYLHLSSIWISVIIVWFLVAPWFGKRSFFQMPNEIQMIGSGIVVFFHSLPIVFSATMYVVLLSAVKKFKQEKNKKVNVGQIPSGNHNNLCHHTKNNVTLKESSIIETSLHKNENSLCNSDVNSIRSVLDQLELPINTISEQIQNTLQSGLPGVICIDLDWKNKENSSGNHHLAMIKSNTCSNNSFSPKLENAKSTMETDRRITKKEKKEESERIAALRSMKTNLLMLSLFLVYGLFTFVPTIKWKYSLYISFASFLKCMMPIVTTFSNFGPVKKAATMYINLIKCQMPETSSN
jgi:hypothetical protein